MFIIIIPSVALLPEMRPVQETGSKWLQQGHWAIADIPSCTSGPLHPWQPPLPGWQLLRLRSATADLGRTPDHRTLRDTVCCSWWPQSTVACTSALGCPETIELLYFKHARFIFGFGAFFFCRNDFSKMIVRLLGWCAKKLRLSASFFQSF